MRILLDENFPADFAKLLMEHDISTVHSRSGRMSDLTPQIPSILAAVSQVTPGQIQKVRR